MPRDIQDLHFRDNIYTEPQTLKKLSILDDVQRTLAYQMAFNGRRWVQASPRVGWGKWQRAYEQHDYTAGDNLFRWDSGKNRRGRVEYLVLSANDKATQVSLLMDNTQKSVAGVKPDATGIALSTLERLHTLGDETPAFKLTKYDTTNDEFVVMLTAPLEFSNRAQLRVGGAPTGSKYEWELHWRSIDDRISGREK